MHEDLFIVLQPLFGDETMFVVMPNTRIEFNWNGNTVRFTDKAGQSHERAVTSIVAIGVGGGSAAHGR